MNWRVLKIVCAVILTSALLKPAFCQNYYIVVGAFTTENDDIREFTSYLPGTLRDTAYTIQSTNSQLHLYVLKTSDRELAIAKAQKLQTQLESKDGELLNSLADYKLSSEPGTEGKKENSSILINQPKNDVTGASSVSEVNASASGSPANTGGLMKPNGKYFKFRLSKPDGSTFPGEVHQVDLQRGRELGSYTANTYVDIPKPGKNQPMTLVCGIFGYKEIDKFVDYSDPSRTEGSYQDDQGAWVIPYRLERLESGDVSIMYNLAFYKDASVMLPNSKRDLDELLNMMSANPEYVIKVHAHCSGKNGRKIITVGDNHNYFEVRGAIEKKGSAKELTTLRGESVRGYLVDHGIDASRIKIFGWGGTAMLVGENDQHAKLNDRIEIEVLKD